MLDFDHASALAVAVLGFGGGILAYVGSRHAKASSNDDDDDAELSFVQDQFIKTENERDAANREREEVSKKAFENIITLLDIVKRLCYMLAISDSSRAELNKREIMTVIKYREFDAKEALLSELTEIFGLSVADLNLRPQAAPGQIVASQEIGRLRATTGSIEQFSITDQEQE